MTDREKVEFIESYIRIGNGDYQWSDNHGELIRCRDCKYYDGISVCTKICLMVSHGDWYCADGERK